MRIYIGGSFDLLHLGHIELFRDAADRAGPWGKVIVAVNTDEFYKQYRGYEPMFDVHERMTMVRAIRYVDQVIVNTGGADSKPSLSFAFEAQGGILLAGSDWEDKDYHSQLGVTDEWLTKNNITIQYHKRQPGVSSTIIKAALEQVTKDLADESG